MKKLKYGLLLTVVALASAAWLLRNPDPIARTALQPSNSQPAQNGLLAANSPSFTTGLEALPKSLQQLEVDGGFDLDNQGHLIINTRLRSLFDFFFTASGEESEQQIINRIRAYIAHALPPEAAMEANQVLDQYLALKQAMDQIPAQNRVQSDDDIAELRQRKNQIKAIRQQTLTAQVDDGFFREEDIFDDYSLSKFEILQNHQLNAAERSARIALLEQSLPEQMRANIEAVTRYQTLTSLTEDWQKSAGNAAELRQIRENIVGAAAADRLEQLDQRRQAWDQQLAQWLQEREQLLKNQALSELEKNEQLERLRAQHFDVAQLPRVRAMERIQDNESPR
ncbi:MAG TPA: lipase secretion chaperone [Pseudomonadales bacterium]|nr:lipase secretion chaperone [Pseudomonadales bacterium]